MSRFLQEMNRTGETITKSKSVAKLERHITYAGVEFVIECGGIENAIRSLDLANFSDEDKVIFPCLANEIERMRKEGKL